VRSGGGGAGGESESASSEARARRARWARAAGVGAGRVGAGGGAQAPQGLAPVELSGAQIAAALRRAGAGGARSAGAAHAAAEAAAEEEEALDELFPSLVGPAAGCAGEPLSGSSGGEAAERQDSSGVTQRGRRDRSRAAAAAGVLFPPRARAGALGARTAGGRSGRGSVEGAGGASSGAGRGRDPWLGREEALTRSGLDFSAANLGWGAGAGVAPGSVWDELGPEQAPFGPFAARDAEEEEEEARDADREWDEAGEREGEKEGPRPRPGGSEDLEPGAGGGAGVGAARVGPGRCPGGGGGAGRAAALAPLPQQGGAAALVEAGRAGELHAAVMGADLCPPFADVRGPCPRVQTEAGPSATAVQGASGADPGGGAGRARRRCARPSRRRGTRGG